MRVPVAQPSHQQLLVFQKDLFTLIAMNGELNRSLFKG